MKNGNKVGAEVPRNIQVKPTEISSVVLRRLIEEVRQEEQPNPSAYNRTHNRHNRGR